MTHDHQAEPQHEFAEAIERAQALLTQAKETGQRVILGICGAPGSGKSTLADALCQALGAECAVAPLDGFHLANEVLLNLGIRDRKGAIDTFDAEGYANLIERLTRRDEEIVYAPAFYRDLEEPVGSSLPIARNVPLVITEGNYLLADAPAFARARACFDLTWFVAPSQELRLSRLVARHMAYGKTREEAEAWSYGSDEVNAKFIASRQHIADWIVG